MVKAIYQKKIPGNFYECGIFEIIDNYAVIGWKDSNDSYYYSIGIKLVINEDERGQYIIVGGTNINPLKWYYLINEITYKYNIKSAR